MKKKCYVLPSMGYQKIRVSLICGSSDAGFVPDPSAPTTGGSSENVGTGSGKPDGPASARKRSGMLDM